MGRIIAAFLMQRRSFIVTAGVGALAAAYGNLSGSVRAPRKHRVVELELITVMSLLNEDFRGTLSNVAAIGYEEVETLGSMGRAPAEVRSILEACHLTSPSQHLVPQDLYGVYQQWDRGVITMAQALDQFIRAFNLAGDLRQREGLTFAYHNGSKVFQRIGIDVAHELILRHTNVHAVKMELDTYYAFKAGADVLTYFARFPGRFPLLHLKDLDRAGEITDLGRGTIDFTAVLHAATLSWVQHMFVEHDRARDPLASARSSFEDVRAI